MGERLQIRDVRVELGGALILDNVTLDVAPGSFMCLLGPSGCGKTTLLRSIAGFAAPSGGDIRLGEHSITRLQPESRQTAMVFQSYALWPHMTVGGNLGYPLRLRGVSRAERDRRIADMLDLLGLPDFANRSVGSLSGGQRQRIALGRALIIDPPVLLLDEPLSNLDAAIRRSLRSELRKLQRKLGITTVMVTHDQEEAMAMADQIAVLRDGRLIQVATPEDLYQRPADEETAAFLGVDNILHRAADGTARVGFRSRDARISADPTEAGFCAAGQVEDCAYTGGAWVVTLSTEHGILTGHGDRSLAIGATTHVAVPTEALIRFGADERLAPEPQPLVRQGSVQ